MFGIIRKRYWKIKNRRILGKQNVQFKTFPNIIGKIDIWNEGIIKIGHSVKIVSSFKNAVVGGYNHTKVCVQNGAELIIGDNVGISNSVISSVNKVEIENNVLIGAGVLIMDSDHHDIDYTKRIHGGGGISAPIIISEGAFIGANSIILKGVTVGKRSIIAAGSVVTKSIPDNEIWGGNPAKRIRVIDIVSGGENT